MTNRSKKKIKVTSRTNISDGMRHVFLVSLILIGFFLYAPYTVSCLRFLDMTYTCMTLGVKMNYKLFWLKNKLVSTKLNQVSNIQSQVSL